jgi:hypothetical protein
MGAIRRAYVYAVALVSLAVMAASVDTVLSWVARIAFGVADPGETPLLSIAGVIVQVPVWVLHWVIAQSSATRHREDRDATIRRVYLVLAVAGAVIGASVGVASVVRTAIVGRGAEALNGAAAIITAIPILLMHRTALIRDLASPETRAGSALRRAYLALVATIAALVVLSSGAGLIAAIVDRLLGTDFDVGADTSRITMIAEMSGALVASALVWATHHGGAIIPLPDQVSSDARRADRESLLPALYKVIVLTVAIATSGNNVTMLLDWVASLEVGPQAPRDVAVAAGAALITYATAWWAFRRALTRDVGDASGTESSWSTTLDRTHRYVVTVVALAVAATGVVQVVGIMLDIAFGATSEAGSYVRDLRFWVAATVTGLPAWVAYWRPPTHPRLDISEVASRPRRGALYVVVFTCAVSLLTAGVWVTYGVLGMVLGKPFDFPTIAFGATIVAAVVGAYHLSVLRIEARQIAAHSPAPPVTVGSHEPSPNAPWAAIRATGAGTEISWHASEAEANAVASHAGARWHAVARLHEAGAPPVTGAPID